MSKLLKVLITTMAIFAVASCSRSPEAIYKFNEKARRQHEVAANQGDADAQYKLGKMYLHGKGGAQDYEKAQHWYQKAANQGDADAQYKLGKMYLHSKRGAQDYEKARHWYQKAAEQGNAAAQNNLGEMYEDGEGGEQDHEKAAERPSTASGGEREKAIFYSKKMNHYGTTYVCKNMEHMKKLVDNLNFAFKEYKNKEWKDLSKTERKELLVVIDNQENIAFNIKKGEGYESSDVNCAFPFTFYFVPAHYEKSLESEFWSIPIDPKGKMKCYDISDRKQKMCSEPVKRKSRSIQGKVFFGCEDGVNLDNHKEKCESSWDAVHVSVNERMKVIKEGDDPESAPESIPTYENGKPLRDSTGAQNPSPSPSSSNNGK